LFKFVHPLFIYRWESHIVLL